jgi:hypothetical protein
MNVDLEVNHNLQKNSLKQIVEQDQNAKKKIDIDGSEENESLNYTENLADLFMTSEIELNPKRYILANVR